MLVATVNGRQSRRKIRIWWPWLLLQMEETVAEKSEQWLWLLQMQEGRCLTCSTAGTGISSPRDPPPRRSQQPCCWAGKWEAGDAWSGSGRAVATEASPDWAHAVCVRSGLCEWCHGGRRCRTGCCAGSHPEDPKASCHHPLSIDKGNKTKVTVKSSISHKVTIKSQGYNQVTRLQ